MADSSTVDDRRKADRNLERPMVLIWEGKKLFEEFNKITESKGILCPYSKYLSSRAPDPALKTITELGNLVQSEKTNARHAVINEPVGKVLAMSQRSFVR